MKVVIACECSYLDSVVGTFIGRVLHRAVDLLSEHRLARVCRREFRLEAIWGDTDLGRVEDRAALAAIDVARLLGEEI